MKAGLDTVSLTVQALTVKVKADHFSTADGISYLETKQLLLLNYCQSLVYYFLCKAKGLSIEGHPVVRSLVKMRLFLEKIRPIDKKLQYQIQKLTRDSDTVFEKSVINEKGTDTQKEDLLNYRPKPDMLVRKTSNTAEVREVVGSESRELTNYMAKMEERAKREEEAFDCAPLTKLEKKKMKHLKKSRNGFLGLTDSFYDEIKCLPLGESVSEQSGNFENGGTRIKQQKKCKVIV
ncbi:hypothetical protein RDI58_011098 [Solanum bulbocastanum]|uniref:Neuroguidin n=1 Tax=Solanum bulbocastanum TaxID=147425 RepID=A0AAN8TUU7_SOLBU